jgi:hypothetical protein
MAVAFDMFFEGGNLEQYDQVIEKMGFSPQGEGAPGGFFHWVTQTDGGLRVVDVWESDEQFNEFAEAKIGPYTQEVGLSEPKIDRYEVHNYLTKG